MALVARQYRKKKDRERGGPVRVRYSYTTERQSNRMYLFLHGHGARNFARKTHAKKNYKHILLVTSRIHVCIMFTWTSAFIADLSEGCIQHDDIGEKEN